MGKIYKNKDKESMFGLFKKNNNYIEKIDSLNKIEQEMYQNNGFNYDNDNNGFSSMGGLTFYVEDVFTIMGKGTVVTGVVEGYVSVGDTVQILKNGRLIKETRVIGIEHFRKSIQNASNNQKVGLLLENVKKNEILSGDIISM